MKKDELIKLLQKRSASYTKDIDESLLKVLEKHNRSNLYSPLKYATMGGKRVRPLILKLRKTNVQFSEVPFILDYKKKPTVSKMNIIKTIFSYLKLLILRVFD